MWRWVMGHGATPDSGASGYPWPSAWAILGPLGAVAQGMVEDLGLLTAGALTAAVVLIRDRRAPPRPAF